jgi:hypothetical protein
LIAQRLPAHYLELLSDALLEVYWYKASFRAALRRAEIPEGLLATWAPEETKRDFWERLLPSLETTDTGIRVLVRLADAVGEQKTFPDLERMEDSELRIKSARKAIADLNDYRQRQRENAQEQREEKKNRESVRKARAESIARQHNLDSLNARLDGLATQVGSQEAGYEFEKWFYDLMDYFEIDNRRPYNGGELPVDEFVRAGSYAVAGDSIGRQLTAERLQPFLQILLRSPDDRSVVRGTDTRRSP